MVSQKQLIIHCDISNPCVGFCQVPPKNKRKRKSLKSTRTKYISYSLNSQHHGSKAWTLVKGQGVFLIVEGKSQRAWSMSQPNKFSIAL